MPLPRVSARLAGPREAAALIETVDRLAEAFPDEAAGGALDPVRDRLVARRDGIVNEGLPDGHRRGRRRLQGRPAQIGKLALPDQPKARPTSLPTASARRCAGHARRFDHATTRGKPEDFHELRKAVKAHAMHLSLLRTLWPTPVKAARKAVDGSAKARRPARHLRPARAAPGRGTAARRRRAKRGCSSASPNAPNASSARLAWPTRRSCSHDRPKRSAKKVARKIRHDLAELQPAAGP